MDAGFYDIVKSVWQSALFGVGVGQFLLALLVFCIFVVLRGAFTKVVIGFFRKLAEKSETKFDDELVEALDQPTRFMFIVIGVFAGASIVDLPAAVDLVMTRLIRSMVLFTIFWTLFRCVQPLSFLIEQLTRMIGAKEIGGALKGFFVKTVKFVILCVGIAAIMEEWNFDVAALLGGLGLLGMAFAFGAQNLIANLFAGLSIIMDRIFDVGDWIRAKDVEGTVESIGFRTTRIRRFDKAITILPNSVLTSGPVINFSRMTNRRIYWKIGILYRSTEPQMRAVVNGIQDYVRTSGDFETDPAKATTLINVDSFNTSSIDIMLYCFTKTTNWGAWMVIKENLAYRIKEIVETAGTGFAFPSSSVYVESLPLGQPEVFPLSGETAVAAVEKKPPMDQPQD